MDFDALFLKRKSVRAYEARPIEDEVKQKIRYTPVLYILGAALR